ncbi:rod shape-determining protein [Streptomyces sp. NPDC004134]|uniref:rod shape-determining protein n=1 Tax=Streptomyces sp. NPDC004134 TaxID=3364691 RepID=UPI0036838E3B
MSISQEQLLRCSVAVDVGATRTRVYLRGIGLVVDEPSAVALNSHTGALVAVGGQAEAMTGRTPDHIQVVRPVGPNGITDIEMAQRMLRHLIHAKVRRSWRFHPSLRAAACTPHDAEPLTQRAMIDTLAGLGAKRVILVDTLIATAVGCGLPVAAAEGTLIVVCGAAMTQIAVLSLGNVVAAEKVPVGGQAVDRALVEHLRINHEVMLRSHTVSQVHRDLSLAGAQGAATLDVLGRDVVSGRPRTVQVDPAAVGQAAGVPMLAVLDGIRSVLRRCPPDLVADIGDHGIVLAGESATMPGLETMLRTSVGLPVRIAERPDVAAVVGLGSMIENGAPPEAIPDATSGPAGFHEPAPTTNPAPQPNQTPEVATEVATD